MNFLALALICLLIATLQVAWWAGIVWFVAYLFGTTIAAGTALGLGLVATLVINAIRSSK